MDKNIGLMLDGRYEIEKRIGAGGMADVYKAYDILEKQVVAVKILKNEFINNDEFLRRFKNESKAVSMLSHPNIVKVFDVGFNEECRFIVMEYIDGITLRDYIENQKVVDWREAVHLSIQILRALGHAHERGIIHRDVKPQNIMMFSDGTIKVMDFGIAKFTYEMGITATAQTIGSVHYISPEQACGKVTDGKSDIYSVGIVLYEMLTGKKPFDTDNPVTVAVMQMNNQAELPRAVNASIPEGIEEIVRKAIEKDPEQRYQSAAEMIKDLESFKNDPEITFGYYKEKTETEDFVPYEGFDPADEYYDDDDYTYHSISHQHNTEQHKVIPEPKNEPVQINDEDDEPTEVLNYYIDNKHEEQNHAPKNYSEPEQHAVKRKDSPMVKLVSALTLFVIIAIIGGVTFLIKGLNDPSKKQDDLFEMPSLEKYKVEDMQKKWDGKLIIKVEGDPVYSVYEADTIVSQSIKPGEDTIKGTVVYVTVSNGKNINVIPDVIGKDFEEAKKILNDAGFSVNEKRVTDEDFEFDQVIKTSPEAGKELEVSKKVTIYISTGPDANVNMVPNVVDKLLPDAEKLLKRSKIPYEVKNIDDKKPEGTVLAQSIAGGTLIEKDDKLVITVSTGKPPEFVVPLKIDYPERAFGVVDFLVSVDNVIVMEKDNINLSDGHSMTFDVSGYDVKDVRIEIRNNATSTTSLITSYSVNFDEKKSVVKESRVNEAFEAVGAVKPPEVTTEAPKQTEPSETVQTTQLTEEKPQSQESQQSEHQTQEPTSGQTPENNDQPTEQKTDPIQDQTQLSDGADQQ